MEFINAVIAVLKLTWKYWAELFLLVALANVIWFYLKEQRTYREQDGSLMVRHGRLGAWVNVINHMTKDHNSR